MTDDHAPQCYSGCQYAADIGMPEHCCSGNCMYLSHPDNQEVAMEIGDEVIFHSEEPLFQTFNGITGKLTGVDNDGIACVADSKGTERFFYAYHLRPVQPPVEVSDPVNHPSHYTSGGIESIEAIKASMTPEAFKGFLKGNVQKYMWRYEKKAKPAEDLKKAKFYLERLIAEVE